MNELCCYLVEITKTINTYGNSVDGTILITEFSEDSIKGCVDFNINGNDIIELTITSFQCLKTIIKNIDVIRSNASIAYNKNYSLIEEEKENDGYKLPFRIVSEQNYSETIDLTKLLSKE